MKKPDNADQEKYWSSPAGQRWIRYEDQMDAVFGNITAAILDLADPGEGDKVLDIGCGTGQTSMLIAQRVGRAGEVLAVDIAQPLLDRAKERGAALALPHLHFRHGDAQIFNFPTSHFDALTSRFGVMFFSDPVKAFANMRRALNAKGRMVFASWASIPENPWFAIPLAAAVSVLGEPKPISPRAPGPLAFAQTDYVLDILRKAGFQNITATPTLINLQPKGGLDGAANLAATVGMASRVMHEYNGTPADLVRITAKVHAGFLEYDAPDGPLIPAMINLYTASA